MPSPSPGEPALTRGQDPRVRATSVAWARDAFLQGARSLAGIRPLVADSWNRSRSSGVDPEVAEVPAVLSVDDLADARTGSPMAPVLPLLRQLLAEPAGEAGHVMAIGDAHGRLLWVEGEPAMRKTAESMGFAAGSLWSEEAAGTNAPGTALAPGAPVQIFATEHYLGVAHRWSCAAVPLRDPASDEVIRVVDVTGDASVAAPHALALVRAAVAAAHAQLRLVTGFGESARQAAEWGGQGWHVEFLGRDHARVHRGGPPIELSVRHSELLLLLATHPSGLSADRMAVLLHEYEVAAVTIRAELNRLRRILGPETIGSRPYRLLVPIRTDLEQVAVSLDSGRVVEALNAYGGPLMPSSESPAVSDLRENLRARLRRAALASRDAEALLVYARTEEGGEDVAVVGAALQRLPRDSRRRPALEARLELLNSRFG